MTRYPKAGKGFKWTIKELDALTPEMVGDTLSDGGGLYGEVRHSNGVVSVHFRYAFRWQDKGAWHYCGSYPKDDLSAIREERDKARNLVKAGIDPRANKKAVKIEAQAAIEATIKADEQKRAENLTFKDLFDEWLDDGVKRENNNKSLSQTFSKHVLPDLGSIPIKALSERDLIRVYKNIISNGKVRTADAISNDIGQMFRWAEDRQPWRRLMVEGNPAKRVRMDALLPSDYSEERDRTLNVSELRKLWKTLHRIRETYEKAEKKYSVERPLKMETELALWICLGTLCRIGELLMTEWSHVDFEARTWFIPKENIKKTRGKRYDYVVFLSDFALDKFRKLHALTGTCKYAFPNSDDTSHVHLKSVTKQVGDRQIQFAQRTKNLSNRSNSNSLVIGSKEWTPHDLRRTGATMMQQLGVSLEVIDKCQNHLLPGPKIRRHYMLYEYQAEKTEAWQLLGRQLEVIFEVPHQ